MTCHVMHDYMSCHVMSHNVLDQVNGAGALEQLLPTKKSGNGPAQDKGK